jgi:hypothetical protein
MPKEVKLKTSKNDASVEAFIESVSPDQLREDSYELLAFFKRVTGLPAKMWGPSIIGFGEYTYYRSNGDKGTFMATGFSPRKSGPTLYILPGYKDYSDILDQLGKHKLGKSCLYLKRLSDINLEVLEKLIRTGMEDLKATQETNF